MQNIIDRILGPQKQLSGAELERALKPLCPTGEKLREWGADMRIVYAGLLARQYGMPKETTVEEAYSEHHRRRCVKLDVPIETSNRALLHLEHGFPREEVLEWERQGFLKDN
jgi:hypothetical protein